MAKINQEEIAAEREAQTAVWEFRKKNYHAENDGQFWSDLCDETDAISNKYKSIYVDMLLLACVADIEIRYMKEKGTPVDSVERLKRIPEILNGIIERNKSK